ncbi:MAG TPA: 3-hydroxyacyl-CoA dehydrogenase [Solirubrobacter sp.]|nr:3-hydroxyacyl-CoA dehydrogenase [Solirubrobacter sp.]
MIAVVGAGSIGVGWTIVFARAGREVAVYDPDPARLEAAVAEFGEHATGRVTWHAELAAALRGAVHVQECAPEHLALKRELFARLDEMVGPGVPLASSSSALTASKIAGELPGRARCLIAHPGNPPYLLPIVEVVPAPFTDPAVRDRVIALMNDVGMSPVHVRREIEGFVFNRLQGALLREAYCLVRDGVASVEDVDRVVRDGPGRRWAIMGPFETADLNTRGGIAVHARRLGPAYARMGAERGQDDPWTDELVERVTRERRALLPLEKWGERVAWRDRALAALKEAL